MNYFNYWNYLNSKFIIVKVKFIFIASKVKSIKY
jgi:hypothetical protein